MPTETYRFPKLTSGNSVYYVGEGSSSPESLMSTGTVNILNQGEEIISRLKKWFKSLRHIKVI